MLELELKCFVAYLSFDARSMHVLLSDSHNSLLSEEMNDLTLYPIFFKGKNNKSAMDDAIEDNLFESVTLIIKYICAYQNKYVYAHLFENNFIRLLQNPAVADAVHMLMESEIFYYDIDFEEWPASHENCESMLIPYHKNLFELREQYEDTFHKYLKIEAPVIDEAIS